FDSDFCLALDKMRLRKLDLPVSDFGTRQWTPSILTRPMFLSITHLSLDIHGFHPIHWREWAQLAALPALTHMAFWEESSYDNDILPHLIAECSRLATAIALFSEKTLGAEFAHSLLITDPRMVVMVVATDVMGDWKIGAMGGDDFWVRADAFVDSKRRGEIESKSPALSLMST
ncbi:hypothetical protein C8R47DRAFT_1171442, partial [Mycena vitilis]